MTPDGIYFNMSEDAYHADPALGSSSIKQLLINPVRWWKKSPHGTKWFEDHGFNTTPSDEETAAKTFGRALHCIVLEPQTFDDKFIEYRIAPPEYARSRDDMRRNLEDAGAAYIPPKSASATDLALACKRAGLKTFDDWKVDWTIEAAGRTELSERFMTTLRLIESMMDMPRPDLDGKSIRENSLTRGAAEVSVFWTEEHHGIPIRMKARIDYLRAIGMIDLKTYAAGDDHQPVHRFLSSVATYGYDLQRSHYNAAWQEMAGLRAKGLVFGASDFETGLVDALKIDPEKDPFWRWIAVQTVGIPEIDRIDFEAGQIGETAKLQRRQAIEAYRQNAEMFGLDEPWVAMRPRIIASDDTFDASRIASRMTSRGEITWETQ